MMRVLSASTSASTTTTATPMSARYELLGVPTWKRGHQSRNSGSLDKIQVIPGFKTSAAFLSSLGANLRITDDDLLPSPSHTPALRPIHDLHSNLPPPSPLIRCVTAEDELDETNDRSIDGDSQSSEPATPLTTEVASSDDDIDAALKLVADSVSEQRIIAARVLVFHPLSISMFTMVLTALMHLSFQADEYGKALLAATGVFILTVALVRQMTVGYLLAAKEVNDHWLANDKILVSKFGGVVIGALVLGYQRGEGRGNKRKRLGKGIVRAWTVKKTYRGKGIGTELLQDAINETKQRGGGEIVFADDHANSNQFLPQCFQSPLVRKDEHYREQLAALSSTRLGRKR